MATKSKIKHYYVDDLLFIDYMDAYNYCVKNLISPNNIVSSYYYKQGYNQSNNRVKINRTI